MIVETEIYLYESSLIDLGIKQESPIWLKAAFDFSKISKIRQDSPEDSYEPFEDMCIISINGENMTIHISYEKAVELWKQSKQETKSDKAEYLTDFLLYLNSRNLINDYDFTYEDVAKDFANLKSGTQ